MQLKTNHDLENTSLSSPRLGLEPWAACSWSMIQQVWNLVILKMSSVCAGHA